MYRRPFFIGLFAFILLVLAVLLFQGPLLQWVIAERARETLGLRLRMKDLTVRWSKGDMQIAGLVASGPQGFEDEPMIAADTVYLDLDWKSALTGRLCFNRVFLVISDITVVRNALGAVNFEQVRDNALRQASPRKWGSHTVKGGEARGDAVFIKWALLRLGKVTYKDYSAGTAPFIQTFPIPVSEIRVQNVTWDELAAGLGVLATAGRSGPGPLIKALSAPKGLGDRMDQVLKGVEKKLKEAR